MPSFNDLPSRVRAIVEEEVAVHALILKPWFATVERVMDDAPSKHVARIRHAIWWRLRHDNQLPNSVRPSYPKIGAWFGRNHTTIMHGVERHPRHFVEWNAAKQQVYEMQRRDHGNRMAASDPVFKAMAYDPA